MDIAELHSEVLVNEIKALWVFAYGSLCWRPGFEFHKAVTGFVKGYQRRFWQGNTTHRGTEDRPGRVATLVEDNRGIVQGVAFAISGEAAIPYLSRRECQLGGYESNFTTFYPVNGKPFKVLTYVASPKNALWVGEEDERRTAEQIIDSRGASGHNVEYLIRLANFMREHFTEHHDQHLFKLEKEVLALIAKRNMCLTSLMGNGEGCVTFVKRPSTAARSDIQEEEERPGTSQYTTRIQGKKLRCVNP
nr:glutathione-specific gamma-glutamylcyclotransferase 1 [Leptinotarsa decemlineata]